MRYETAIGKMFALQARGMRLGIERMREGIAYRRLDADGLPPMLQIAGTNGKGSVAAMIASGLRAAGYRTGLFTSPHLHRFTERIQIDGRPLSTREAARRIGELLDAFGQPGAPFVSFFELSTLMAVEAFRDHGCDLAVMEVGLGGRLDATNALPAVLTVITRIAFDHERVLGRSLAQIARQKAGIIKPGVPVIVGSREPDVLNVIRKAARAKSAPARYIDRQFWAREVRGDRVAFEVSANEVVARVARSQRVTRSVRASKFGARVTRGETATFSVVARKLSAGKRKFGPVKLGLPGEHQRDNAACAVAALAELDHLGFRVPASAIVQGLHEVRWPARLERVAGRPAHLLDAAHNPDGCAALAEYLRAQAERPRVLVFGVMRDKNYSAMLKSLAPEIDAVFYAQARIARAEKTRALQKVLPGVAAKSVGDALARAKRRAGPKGLVVVAGSIFLVAEARAKLLRVPTDPLIRM